MLKRKEDEGATALVRVCLPLPTAGRQNRSSFRTSHPPNYTNEMDQRARLAIFLPALLLLAPQRRHPFSFPWSEPFKIRYRLHFMHHPPTQLHSFDYFVYMSQAKYSGSTRFASLAVAFASLTTSHHPPAQLHSINLIVCMSQAKYSVSDLTHRHILNTNTIKILPNHSPNPTSVLKRHQSMYYRVYPVFKRYSLSK